MSDNKILTYEREVLSDTKRWIESEEERLEGEKLKANEKLDALNKKSKGAYDPEIEIVSHTLQE